jgi:hypothetical protein
MADDKAGKENWRHWGPKRRSTQLFFTSHRTIKCVSGLLAFIVP